MIMSLSALYVLGLDFIDPTSVTVQRNNFRIWLELHQDIIKYLPRIECFTTKCKI